MHDVRTLLTAEMPLSDRREDPQGVAFKYAWPLRSSLPAPRRLEHRPYQTRPGLLPLPGTARDVISVSDDLVKHARSLLVVLAAGCTFGASLAFETLQSAPLASQAYLAWAFMAFVLGMVTTLLWQAVLVADFRGFSGRVYRS
ncbi:hypothetical protein AURDEDRAFT_121922 [Auricularia subglabra TFB-10046 SS5]|nr:hypothetical protein AURDEDRAFT_121922 [Auricularia subglabra TFB-10046 SS5]